MTPKAKKSAKAPAKKTAPKKVKSTGKQAVAKKKTVVRKKAAAKKDFAKKRTTNTKKRVAKKKTAVKKSTSVKRPITKKVTPQKSKAKRGIVAEVENVVTNNIPSSKEKCIVEHTIIPDLPILDKNSQQGKFARNYDKHEIQISSVKKGGPKPSGKKPLW